MDLELLFGCLMALLGNTPLRLYGQPAAFWHQEATVRLQYPVDNSLTIIGLESECLKRNPK